LREHGGGERGSVGAFVLRFRGGIVRRSPTTRQFPGGNVGAMADPKSFLLSSELADYLVAHGTPPDDTQCGLIAETAALGPVAGMQVSPEQGAFLTILARAIGARRAIEVGTFTGYS